RNDLIHAEERGCDSAAAITAIEKHVAQFSMTYRLSSVISDRWERTGIPARQPCVLQVRSGTHCFQSFRLRSTAHRPTKTFCKLSLPSRSKRSVSVQNGFRTQFVPRLCPRGTLSSRGRD